MKNVLKAFALVALVAAIGFSMAACDDDGGGGGGGSGSLSGTRWKYDVSSGGYTVSTIIAFTGSSNYKVTSSMPYLGEFGIDSGTYTFDGKRGTLSSPNGAYDTATFSVSGNKLTLYARAGYGESDTVFTKQ